MKGKQGFQKGLLNPSYKGDKIGYSGAHVWARGNIPLPKICRNCQSDQLIDAANISGQYKQELTDWKWLCRKCHMDEDGRNERLRQSGKSRKLPTKICPVCEKEFHSDARHQIRCSRKCYFLSRTKESNVSN